MRRGGDQTRVGVRVRVSRWVGVRVAGGCFFGEVFRVEEEAKVCSFVCTCCEDEVKLQQTWVCFPFAAATCSASERVWCLPSPPRVRGAVARRFPHGNYPILTRNKRKRDRRGGGSRKERQKTLLNFHPILPCVPLPPTSPSRPPKTTKMHIKPGKTRSDLLSFQTLLNYSAPARRGVEDEVVVVESVKAVGVVGTVVQPVTVAFAWSHPWGRLHDHD